MAHTLTGSATEIVAQLESIGFGSLDPNPYKVVRIDAVDAVHTVASFATHGDAVDFMARHRSQGLDLMRGGRWVSYVG